ncbi:MAG: hypothetical protein ACYTEO_00695 [Planctomycetota bacterium]|jgi:hypothetical protein
MKTKGQKLLTIALVTCVLAGLTANSFAKLGHEQKSLIGIERIVVSVSCTEEAAKEAGLKKENLRKDAATQLKQAGIKIMPEKNKYSLPYLRIRIKAYKLPRQETFIYNLEIHFLQTVALPRNPETKITATTWELTWLAHAHKARFVEGIRGNLRIMVKEFIRDYRKANPKADKPAEVSDANAVSLTTQKEPSKQPAKLAVAEHKYIASKNSKVFHKSDCRWVKRISAKNLVGYSSRDEAIEAGKRPCKTCKP